MNVKLRIIEHGIQERWGVYVITAGYFYFRNIWRVHCYDVSADNGYFEFKICHLFRQKEGNKFPIS